MRRFLETLRVQRWDDHRFYHHSRVNQSLHLVSAVSFLFAYAMVFQDPAMAALIGWLVAMTSRQVGHFFFEPKDYDVVNQATHVSGSIRTTRGATSGRRRIPRTSGSTRRPWRRRTPVDGRRKALAFSFFG